MFGLMLALLTTLPLRVAQFEVSAGAGRVLLGAVRTAQGLDLVVEGLECGVDLNIMLPLGAGGLICPHVPERIGGLLSLTQASKGGDINAWAWWTRRTRGSRVTRRTLKKVHKQDMRPDWNRKEHLTAVRFVFTYRRTSFSRTSTRSRRSDGARLSIRSIFASRSNWSRWSLQTHRVALY